MKQIQLIYNDMKHQYYQNKRVKRALGRSPEERSKVTVEPFT